MKIIIAKEAGFCFGVKRALNLIAQLNEEDPCIQIYGPLIHNRSVLENLEKKGIQTITHLDEIDKNKKLVIRTHGIPKDTEAHLHDMGIHILDATCPFVKKIHHIIEDINHQENLVVFVGDKNHPEVIAAKSYAPADNTIVIDSLDEAHHLPTIPARAKTSPPSTPSKCFHGSLVSQGSGSQRCQISVVAQTTLDADFFKEAVAILSSKTEKIEVYDTICNATKKRQQAIKELAPNVDCVIVVGGKNSSNTRKLYEIARQKNPNTFHIESSSDLNDPVLTGQLKSFQSVGITAGASTPPDEITKVKKFLKNLKIDNPDKELKNGRTKRYFQHKS